MIFVFAETKRRLGFLKKEGYDLFGNNELFAPRVKWETLKGFVEDIRVTATSYESSYNSIGEMIANNDDFQQV